jgi:uncharacterized membrane protein
MELAVTLLHPAVVHFPIALLVVNYGLSLAYFRWRDTFFEQAAYGALVLGWCGSFAAVLTGTLALALSWPLRSDVVGWINLHAVLGLALLWVYGQALLRRRRDPQLLDGPQRRAYFRQLTLGLVLLLVDGWVGGHLVYGLGFGIR